MAAEVGIDSDPDLSHLSESERRIIFDVLQRQKRDDIENDKILRNKQEEKMQEVSPSSTTVERNLMIKSPESIFLGSQQANYGEVCHVCQITKFADSAGKSCFLCSNKACSRCGFSVEINQNSKRTIKWCCRNCKKKEDRPEIPIKISRTSRSSNIDLTDLDIGIPSPSLPSKPDFDKNKKKSQDHDIARQKSSIDRKTSCPVKLTTLEDHLNHKSENNFFPEEDEEEEEEIAQQLNTNVGYGYSEISDKLIYSQAQFYCGNVTPLPEKQVKSHFKYINTPMEMSRSPVLVDSGFIYNDGSINRNDFAVYSPNNSQSFNRIPRQSNSSKNLIINDQYRFNMQHELAVSPTTNILVNSKEISANEFNAESIPYFKSRRNKTSARRKLETLLRNDSLSSDPSEAASRKIVSPTKLHSYYHNRKLKQSSFSSSEDDLPTSIECTSGDDKELEIDSLSERDIYPTNQWLDPSNRKNSRLGQNRSFDKDSGISEGHHREYSSEMVSQLQNANYKLQGYEDRNNPVTWKPSKDGKRLIGHMILRKCVQETLNTECTSGILGLKVVGGKLTVAGQRRAYITKVKPDSIADTVGHLLAGDEVIEWNSKSFRGLSNEEVNEIISDSKHEGSVELIVQRNLDGENNCEQLVDSMHYEIKNNCDYPDMKHKYLPPSDSIGSLGNSATIQMRLFYNTIEMEFIVNLISATNLTSSNYTNYSSFVQLIVGSEKRESTIISDSVSPYWDQDFIFKNILDHYLKANDLVCTVFYYDHIYNKYTPIAEVIIDLSKADFSNRLYSYPLTLYYDQVDKDIDTPTPIYRSSADSSIHSSSTYNKEMSTISPPPIPERRSPKKHGHDNNFVPDYEGLDNLHIYCDSPIPASEYRGSYTRYDSPNHIDSRKVFSPNFSESNVSSRKSSVQMYKSPTNNCYEYHSSKPYRRSSQGRQHMCYSQRSSSQRRDSVESDRVHHVMPRCCPNEFTHRDTDQQYSGRLESPKNEYRSYSAVRFHKKRKGSFQQSDNSDEIIGQNISNENSQIQPISDDCKCDLDENGKRKESLTSNVTDLELLQTIQSSDEGPQRLPEVHADCGRKRRPSIGQKFSSVLRISRKSNSTSNLEKKARTSFQRSEEVVPAHIKISTECNRINAIGPDQCESAPVTNLGNTYNIFQEDMIKQANRKSRSAHNSKSATKSKNSNNQKPSSLNDNQVGVFVEGLGPGQLVGRQVLGMPSLGELQLSFIDKKGRLDIEVIRARGLTPKPNSKVLPQPYVKIYLMDGKNIIEKQKTLVSPRRTLDPLYQQQLSFSSEYSGKVLQATVWGEYSRMDKKSFMGRCEILLDDLDFSSIVFGWYKLYSSIASELPHPTVQTRRLSTSSIGK